MTQSNGTAAEANGRPAGRHGQRRGGQIDANGVHGEDKDSLRAAYGSSNRHLIAFAKTRGKNGAPRWDADTQTNAASLLYLYFYGTSAYPRVEVQITAMELKLSQRVVAEVRRRFTSACHFNPTIQGTPGQNQPWFTEVLARTVAFHVGRRAAAAAGRTMAKAIA